MKILILSPLPPPVGGIASWTVNILNYYEYDPSIKISHLNTAVKHRDITRLDTYSRIQSGLRDSREIIKSLSNKIRQHNPDIIHVTSSGSFGLARDLLILLIAKIYKIPVVIHFRFGRIPILKDKNNWEWKLLSKVAALSSAVLVLDSKSKNILKYSNIENVYITPNPISKDVEDSILNNSSLSLIDQTDSFVKEIIFVGHITKNKGVFELVQACSSIATIDKLTLIGPYEKETKAQLTNIALQKNLNIVFSGVLDKKSVLSKMKNSALLVLPSYTEGFPNVIIEAMAMGCPIIATDVGAISDILDINTTAPSGVVIKPRDVNALSSAIQNFLNNQDLAKEYSENAINKVLNFYTLDKVCSLYEDIWKSVIHNQR